ncbi:copper amine oxidase N-terminal domain-containing protein [Heliophilum fasciatum]|uniref:Copper amine oxidase-like protein n=1 Tax=Heliophilum fasciatum TaxID=35700 RepID=A0A4R2S996_9FIRM|nr:copper amine oxidase N-terminal domain-containing protein [Heliophilum fasciatum]MCW2276626.1 hypothetical protein [Heliophilum fasciatum]TCP68991.1 copper amine oxidase-like protein [Heliophilum fasciatum]
MKYRWNWLRCLPVRMAMLGAVSWLMALSPLGLAPSLAATAPVEAAQTLPLVYVGKTHQAAGDIVLTEGMAGSLSASKGNDEVRLYLPRGVEFDGLPQVDVVQGDLLIDPSSVSTYSDGSEGAYLRIRLRADSTTPSTLRVSSIYLRLQRMVPDGDIVVKLKGSATADDGIVAAFGRDTAAEIPIARAVTAPVGVPSVTTDHTTKVPTGFQERSLDDRLQLQIGRPSVRWHDRLITMEQAPQLLNDHAMIPLRSLALVMGLSPGALQWDGSTGTVHIGVGAQSCALQVGSTTMSLPGGQQVSLPVAPQIMEERMFVPLRAIAQVFGVEVQWHGDDQTISLNPRKS